MNTMTFFLYGNYDYAGTEKFTWHVIEEDGDRTLCGLRLSELRGDWQFEDFNREFVHCKKCKKALTHPAALSGTGREKG